MVTHPHLDPQIAQAQVLLEMTETPKEQRYTELLFSFGNASYRYHSLADNMELNTKNLWEEWLAGLPAHMAANFAKEGYERGQSAIPFTRYVMERSDIGFDAYVKELMGEEDYAEFQKGIEDQKQSENL